MGTEQSTTSTAPDGDVVTETTATSSTPSTQTKTEPAAPDRSNAQPAPINRGEIEPNKKG
jgi:hypothetical protein